MPILTRRPQPTRAMAALARRPPPRRDRHRTRRRIRPPRSRPRRCGFQGAQRCPLRSACAHRHARWPREMRGAIRAAAPDLVVVLDDCTGIDYRERRDLRLRADHRSCHDHDAGSDRSRRGDEGRWAAGQILAPAATSQSPAGGGYHRVPQPPPGRRPAAVLEDGHLPQHRNLSKSGLSGFGPRSPRRRDRQRPRGRCPSSLCHAQTADTGRVAQQQDV